MVLDERPRHYLYLRLEEALGAEAAATLMEHLPPLGWADVAMKRDLDLGLDALEQPLELRIEPWSRSCWPPSEANCRRPSPPRAASWPSRWREQRWRCRPWPSPPPDSPEAATPPQRVRAQVVWSQDGSEGRTGFGSSRRYGGPPVAQLLSQRLECPVLQRLHSVRSPAGQGSDGADREVGDEAEGHYPR